jgi:DNA-directed RNA polymerase specialized sigma24 family protein
MSGPVETRSFEEFMVETEPRVRRALISGFGSRLGREATVDAFEYGWEHWDRISRGANPAGYVYRTGVRCGIKARRKETRRAGFEVAGSSGDVWAEPKLDGSLDRLTDSQRVCVVLVHGFEWTYQEVADLLDVRRSTVQRHVDRGMAKLRSDLGVRDAVA